MKKLLALLLSVATLFVFAACSANENYTRPETTEDEITKPVTQPETKPATTPITESEIDPSILENTPVKYDALQRVFLALNNETTIENLNSLIADNNLEFTSQDYNGAPKQTMVKLAYSHDVALQKYAESGDYVEVAFDKRTGALLYATYFNQNAFKTAIYYNYGTYWDFREDEANNRYTGYYYYKPGDSKGGITMEYDNGNKTETGYHKCSDGEKAIKNVT